MTPNWLVVKRLPARSRCSLAATASDARAKVMNALSALTWFSGPRYLVAIFRYRNTMPSAEVCQVASAPRSRHRLEYPVRRTSPPAASMS